MQLAGLPLIPLRDGSLGRLDVWTGDDTGQAGTFILSSTDQEELLANVPRLVADREALGATLAERCTSHGTGLLETGLM